METVTEIKITTEQFKAMPAGHIFAKGEFLLVTDGDQEEMQRFVAVKSKEPGVNDWAVYYLPLKPNTNDVYIRWHGIKIHDMPRIQLLTKCDDEMLTLYRH